MERFLDSADSPAAAPSLPASLAAAGGTGGVPASPPAANKLARYDQLKQQVRDIKAEHKGVQHAKAANREAKAAAASEAFMDLEERLEAERRASATLQQRLKEALDRSARMRQQADRERRALQAQIERLEGAAEQALRQAAEAEAARAAEHEQETRDLEARLQAERELREQTLRDAEESRAAFVAEVEEWSQGEVEAVQAVAAERVERAEAAVIALEERAEGLRELLATRDTELKSIRTALSDAQSEADRQSSALEALQSKLAASEAAAAGERERREQEAVEWKERVEDAKRDRDAVASALKAQHVAELDQVHTKLQSILRRKDARITALQSQLAEAEARHAHTEAILERQRAALLAQPPAGEKAGGHNAGGAMGAVLRGAARPGTAS